MKNNDGFDYFYQEQTDQFSFYRIPKSLFIEDRFRGISTDAKVLYGLLLDRVSLSTKNKWIDEQGRIYIIYTIRNIQLSLGCADKKATRLLAELEAYGLIEKRKRGQGKPTIIYVKNFIVSLKQRFKDCQNNDSRVVEATILDQPKQRCNYTDMNKTDYSDTNHILSDDGMKERNQYRNYFKEELCIETIKTDYPYNEEIIEGILELILDVVCSKKETVRIAGEDMLINIVKSRFMKLNFSHIVYVIHCMKENTTKVRSIKQYLLTSLYNAPITIGSYYQALVNNDMASGKV